MTVGRSSPDGVSVSAACRPPLMGSIHPAPRANNGAHRGCGLNDVAIQVIASIDGGAQFSLSAAAAQNETIIAIVSSLSRSGV